MIPSVFFLTAITGICSYALASAALERYKVGLVIRRLVGKPSSSKSTRAPKPLLIQAVDEVRGRLAVWLLDRLRLKQKTERLLEVATLKWGAAGLLHRSIGLFLAGFAIITLLTGNTVQWLAIAGGITLGFIPSWYVRRKARLRVRSFEEQFPDCLEFLARSMRAGHAFIVALEMTYTEFNEPLAGEFRRVFEEQNLGQPLNVVLHKLSERIPSLDVQFFVSAVLLQKRTGGNLAEPLEKLAQLIRERFKLRARIRAVSAQGLMSGRILSAIPMAVAALMFAINPQYAKFFFVDPTGHWLLGVGLGMQCLGYLIIRRIVRIEI